MEDDKKSVLPEEELKKKLTPVEYHILREKGTEPPFSGKYATTKEKGMYKCKVCGNPLFSSDTKFDSGTGWPSFTDPATKTSIEYREDSSHGMKRVEVVCKKCGSHLGHVFDDGPKNLDNKPATGKRYCLNSVCLELDKEASKK